MSDLGMERDAITYSALISALSKGRQWGLAIDVFNHMVRLFWRLPAFICAMLGSPQLYWPSSWLSWPEPGQAHPVLLLTNPNGPGSLTDACDPAVCPHAAKLAAQVAEGVECDAVTCCSLITALDKGGQWQLAEQV